MNTNSLRIFIPVVIIFLLATYGLYRLYQGKVVRNPIPSPSPIASVIGFPTTLTPTPSPIVATPPSQPASGSDSSVKNIGISVKTPQQYTVVNSPLFVKGKANVFEGNVQIRLRDENGKIIGSAQATACMDLDACQFEATVEFQKPTTNSGTLEVFSPAPMDGSESYKQIILIQF